VASLGKEVVLAVDMVGPCETYQAGCRGVLAGIEICRKNYDGAPYAIVALDPNDDTYLENFRFSDLMPVTNKVKFSLNIEEGIIAF
jgi:hypothetical protein